MPVIKNKNADLSSSKHKELMDALKRCLDDDEMIEESSEDE